MASATNPGTMRARPEAPGAYQGTTAANVESRTSRKAIASLVLSIIGVLVAPIVFSTAGIVFGVLARQDIKRNRALGGAGLATAGIVVGVVGIVLGLIVGIAVLAGH